ncbi:hypothetical protein DFQ26_001654, partial [Actinomortierella ambigua]
MKLNLVLAASIGLAAFAQALPKDRPQDVPKDLIEHASKPVYNGTLKDLAADASPMGSDDFMAKAC